MDKSVFIVAGNAEYRKMFVDRGWDVVASPEDADLIQFTGGADVSPAMYGEYPHPSTHFSPERDRAEHFLYMEYIGKKPMAGICRGGQFLNVMNGGTLYQHVDGHAIGGTHVAYTSDQREIQVTSTHHQMMRPGKLSKVLATAQESDSKEYMRGKLKVIDNGRDQPDVEAVLYKQTRCLCFQPHPEFGRAPKECTDYYFELLEEIV